MKTKKSTSAKKSKKALTPVKYRIYGIFNMKTKKLLAVDLDLDKLSLEFELEGYDKDVKLINFDLVLTNLFS